MVFNTFNYSTTTNRHQRDTLNLFRRLNIHNILYIKCPNGLQDLESGIHYYNNMITELRALINKKGTRKVTNAKRQYTIDACLDKIYLIQRLQQLKKAA